MDERIFVVSYPKSGRTWMRVLLSRYVQKLLGIEEFQLKLHDRGSDDPFPTPKFIFTHARSEYFPKDHSPWQKFLAHRGWLKSKVDFPFDLSKLNGKKVIFLLRDPRDTIVSYYHQLTKRQGEDTKPYTMTEFIRNPLLGAGRLMAFMNRVAQEKNNYEHHFVYYEDLKADTCRELTAILQFSGIAILPELVKESIDFAQFNNMRKMELQGSHGNKLQPGNEKDPDSFKVRKGKVGTFQQELNEEEIRYLDTLIDRELNEFYQRYKYVTK